MFLNERVNHKKFGAGVITDINLNPQDEFKSLVEVKFDSGETKKISVSAFSSKMGFITSENPEVIEYVDNLEKESNKNKQKRIESIVAAIPDKADKLNNISYCEFDEEEREVTIEEWEQAASVAGDYRFYGESRAVVMDKKKVFINASAGCRFIEARVKDGDKLYKACEAGNKFSGHKWAYATRQEIEKVMELMEENETK